MPIRHPVYEHRIGIARTCNERVHLCDPIQHLQQEGKTNGDITEPSSGYLHGIVAIPNIRHPHAALHGLDIAVDSRGAQQHFVDCVFLGIRHKEEDTTNAKGFSCKIAKSKGAW